MKEKEFVQKLKNKEEKILLAMILDKYHSFLKNNIPTYSNFLSESELDFVKKSLTYLKIPFQVFVANENCERSVVFFGAYSNFISFYHTSNKGFKHSDVLGALFGCGFSTSMIGDIFVLENDIYLTNLERYDFLLENSFTQIGKEKILINKIELLPEIRRNFEEINLFLESTRLDLVISKLINKSRSKTILYIKEYKVLLNYKQILKYHENLKENDILSIEKIGKFKIIKIEVNEKNNKIRVLLNKYC